MLGRQRLGRLVEVGSEEGVGTRVEEVQRVSRVGDLECAEISPPHGSQEERVHPGTGHGPALGREGGPVGAIVDTPTYPAPAPPTVRTGP